MSQPNWIIKSVSCRLAAEAGWDSCQTAGQRKFHQPRAESTCSNGTEVGSWHSLSRERRLLLKAHFSHSMCVRECCPNNGQTPEKTNIWVDIIRPRAAKEVGTSTAMRPDRVVQPANKPVHEPSQDHSTEKLRTLSDSRESE